MDIKHKVYEEFGIDIQQDNLFKLYKIVTPDLPASELEAKIEETRRRWSQSVNGANEKNAKRDQLRLEKADRYEAVLRDAKLRNALFAYYNEAGGKAGKTAQGTCDFAKEYFRLLSTSKKLSDDDVAFFFEYYTTQRKFKKDILQMLDTDYKINGLGSEKKYADEGEEIEVSDKKKKKSPRIANLFQKETVLLLRKCEEFYQKACENEEVCRRYPALQNGLYAFLALDKIGDAEAFSNLAEQKGGEVFTLRQEYGTDYIPLVDLFNTLRTLLEHQDVKDNIPEFKLLIKYPTLTPYMYSFVNMTPKTLQGVVNVADQTHAFRDQTDFILNYYNPVHDNFGITNSGIEKIIKKAKKMAAANKLLNAVDGKLGRKTENQLPFGAKVMHFLLYWPIFLAYFLFEAVRLLFTNLYRATIPFFVVGLVAYNLAVPRIWKIENIFYLRKIFVKDQWYAYITVLWGEDVRKGFGAFVLSLFFIVIMVALYVIPPLFAAHFLGEAAEELNKRYDWIGYKRTFQSILQNLKKQAVQDYKVGSDIFYKKRIVGLVVNLVCIAALTAGIICLI